jgi:hypothetical protein
MWSVVLAKRYPPRHLTNGIPNEWNWETCPKPLKVEVLCWWPIIRSKVRCLTLSVPSQFYKYHFFSLAQTWVHSYEITSRTKQAVYTKFQLWIDKTATFNLTPSGITSHLTLTVSCVLNRPSWPLLRGLSPEMGGKQTLYLFPQVCLHGRCRGSDW